MSAVKRPDRRVDQLGHAGIDAGHLPADRNPGDPQLAPAPVIALNQHPDRKPAIGGEQTARGRAGAALEAVTVHSGSAADVPLGYRPPVRILERLKRMLGLHVKALHVVQSAVGGLGHDRIPKRARRIALDHPVDHGVPDSADAERVGDHDRGFEDPDLLDPVGAGHVAVAVAGVEGGKHRFERGFAPRQNGGDPGSNRSLADDPFSFALDQGDEADLDSGHVGDGVIGAWGAVERNAEITSAGFGWALSDR